ncbi:MAG: hypothetical protein ACKVQA_06935 [Burkholderiales bacterium]
MKALTITMACEKGFGKQRLVMPPKDQNKYAAMVAKLGIGEVLQGDVQPEARH